ncbi:Potassium voltage-gated channel subfamily A member 3 [Fasciolopsis buskii]|uniref:Potassium voltage-gated channel subfamily A member 3 n=1 Tax=Fasciolopsis buskii TaxID=27845 RepID=A0A8E0S385_9TREM|nr:Potassium voltage-gated channel subfamily A member 3 [Fasciolopsis buski]
MIYMPSFMKPIKECASETTSCNMLAVSTGDLHKQMCSCLRSSESAVGLTASKPVPSDIRHPFYRHLSHRHHKSHQHPSRTRAGFRETSKTAIPHLMADKETAPLCESKEYQRQMPKQHSFPGSCCLATEGIQAEQDRISTSYHQSAKTIHHSWSLSEWSHNKRHRSADAHSTPCLNLAYENKSNEVENLSHELKPSECLPDLCWSQKLSEEYEEQKRNAESAVLLAESEQISENSEKLQTLTNRLLYFPNISTKLKVQFANTNRGGGGSTRSIYPDESDEDPSKVEYEANCLPIMDKPLIGPLIPLISTRNSSVYGERIQVLVERKGHRNGSESARKKAASKRYHIFSAESNETESRNESFRRQRLKSISVWRAKQGLKIRRACGLEDPTKDNPLLLAGQAVQEGGSLINQNGEVEPSSSNNSEAACQDCQRVVLNVSGLKFETWLAVLNNHPTTLLGNAEKRMPFFDAQRKEYFFDRHRPSFEAIFNYYQYGGRIKRPAVVADDIFLRELEFFQIEQDALESYKKSEGYVPEVIILPENPIKRKLWLLFEYPETSPLAFCFSVTSVIFTIISIILFCVETLPVYAQTHCEPGAKPNFRDPFFIIETICTIWFTFELIIRFSSCPSHKTFVKDFKNLIDLAAIIPYYITLTNVLITFSCEGAKSSASLAFLRVIRLIRVFKLTKHSSGLQVLVLTFKESIEGLGLFLVAFIVCILVFSSTLYYVEIDRKGSQIESIPDAFWWAVITMCTVGYGDKVPKGPLGKIVGSVCAVAGVLTLAIPVPIITENFNKFYAHKTGRGRR